MPSLNDTLQDVDLRDPENSAISISETIKKSETQLSSLNSHFEAILSSKIERLNEVTELQGFTGALQTLCKVKDTLLSKHETANKHWKNWMAQNQFAD